MKTQKRGTSKFRTTNIWAGCMLIALFGLLGAGCDKSTKPDADDNSSSEQENSSEIESSSEVNLPPELEYQIDTVLVDYRTENKHMVAYLDFSASKITHIAYDAWDIAISVSNGGIIANGGDWGTGVRVYKTDSKDIQQDLSELKDSVVQVVNADGNPFVNEFNEQGVGTGNVYLIKDNGGEYHKVVFGSYGPMGKYSVTIVAGLDGEAEQNVTGFIQSDYGYTYIALSKAQDVSDLFPKATEWDVKFGRGAEFMMGTSLSARSVVTFNSGNGVSLATFEDTKVEDVLSVDAVEFVEDRNTIGASWYTFDHDTKIYTPNINTYVFKTVENGLAKLQLRTFYGPEQQQYWSIIKWAYQEDSESGFSK
jgi:hypothetical protein